MTKKNLARAKRRRQNYTVRIGTFSIDVTKAEFVKALYEGWTTLVDGTRHVARVCEHLVASFNKHTQQLEVRLARTPEFDPAGVKSWWRALVERHLQFHVA